MRHAGSWIRAGQKGGEGGVTGRDGGGVTTGRAYREQESQGGMGSQVQGRDESEEGRGQKERWRRGGHGEKWGDRGERSEGRVEERVHWRKEAAGDRGGRGSSDFTLVSALFTFLAYRKARAFCHVKIPPPF